MASMEPGHWFNRAILVPRIVGITRHQPDHLSQLRMTTVTYLVEYEMYRPARVPN